MTRKQFEWLAAALTIGLSIGWVVGSWQPWSPLAVLLGFVLGFAWLIWTHWQLKRDMDQWTEFAETAKRLLDETEADDETP